MAPGERRIREKGYGMGHTHGGGYGTEKHGGNQVKDKAKWIYGVIQNKV